MQRHTKVFTEEDQRQQHAQDASWENDHGVRTLRIVHLLQHMTIKLTSTQSLKNVGIWDVYQKLKLLFCQQLQPLSSLDTLAFIAIKFKKE